MNAQAARQEQAWADRLADQAVQALLDEVALSPKPALVDQRGSGAHRDLNLSLMQASAWSLWSGFQAMAQAAQAEGQVTQALRERIGQLGREAEAEMLRVTEGVNTHRGAIWALGLLVTATALNPKAQTTQAIARSAAELARLPDRQAPAQAPSNGQRVMQRYGVRGARGEAQAGFPSVVLNALPQLRASRTAGATESQARLDALLAIMATLEDTCVLHRAGLDGLLCMQQGSRAVLESGGSATLMGRQHLRALDQTLVALNASPGGAADLLAATLFLDALETDTQRLYGRDC